MYAAATVACRRAAAAHQRKTTVRTVPRAPRTATIAEFAPATIVLGARPQKIEKGALYTKSSSHNQDGAEILLLICRKLSLDG